MSTNHNFWRERRAEAVSNRGPSAFLPLGQSVRGERKLFLSNLIFRGSNSKEGSQGVERASGWTRSKLTKQDRWSPSWLLSRPHDWWCSFFSQLSFIYFSRGCWQQLLLYQLRQYWLAFFTSNASNSFHRNGFASSHPCSIWHQGSKM